MRPSWFPLLILGSGCGPDRSQGPEHPQPARAKEIHAPSRAAAPVGTQGIGALLTQGQAELALTQQAVNLGQRPDPAWRPAQAFEQVLEQDPANKDALLGLIQLHAALEAPGTAQRWADHALERWPDDARFRRWRGEIAQRSGRTEEAVAHLEEALSGARAQGDWVLEAQTSGALGECLIQLGRLAEAEALLLEVTTLVKARQRSQPIGPTVNCPHNALRQLYDITGRGEAAMLLLVEGARLDPENPGVQAQAAAELLTRGDSLAALVHLDRALERGEGAGYRTLRTSILQAIPAQQEQLRRSEEALGAHSVMLLEALRPDLAQELLGDDVRGDLAALAGLAALRAGDPDAAEAWLARAEDPGMGRAVLAGEVALGSGDPQGAARTLGAALEAHQPAGDAVARYLTRCAQLGLGSVALDGGDAEGAIDLFRAVLDERPDTLEALIGLGEALGAGGAASEAQRAFRRAYLLEPRYTRAQQRPGLQLFLSALDEGRVGEAAPGAAAYSCPFQGPGLSALLEGARPGDASRGD